ncbi:MAG: hypothetical protein HN981_04060 [Candidatus Pacebacteria bacterium]|mgnify:CR=1 FL=1|jgi:hypothetical protein|nr:hypothetical protein [Candidatus Paceibacterota bacterium]MBT4652421.1 hypothetical protein [Candidatus Paceibacterota bacterium]MBT6756248.1 hypothetical protein [Candidatus Paceibacterota bacterium]MBT6921539.1 hypothetical protein [Candidatus Paceibacterota bacterium]
MTEGSSPKPSFKEKMSGFGQKIKENKIANSLGKRAEEGAAVTRATQGVNLVTDTAVKAGHAAGEVADKFGKGVDVVGDRAGQLGKNIELTAGNLKDSIHKDLSDEVIIAKLKEAGIKVTEKIRTEVEAVIGREIKGRISSLVAERVVPVLKTLGLKKEKAAEEVSETTDEKPEEETSERSQRRAESTIEGSKLISDIMGNLDAAVKFDQVRDSQLPALLEKSLGSTELAKKVGPVVLKSLTALIMESASFGGKTGGAMESLSELLNDPATREELEKSNVSMAELLEGFNDALKSITETKQLVLDSRGEDKDLSWEYEGKQVESSEKAQEEAFELGWEVVDALPKSAADLTIDKLITARVKAIDFSRKSMDVIRPLKKIAMSMEQRFPGKAKEIRAALLEAIAPWQVSKGVVNGVSEAIVLDRETMRQASGDIFKELIKPNEMFGALNRDQKTEVMEKVGGKMTDENKNQKIYDKHEVVPGSMYENALQAYGEYAKLLISYDSLRDHVENHPEAADQLMVLAERIMQAKSVLEFTKNKIASEVIVQSRIITNRKEASSSEKQNTASELKTQKERREYYTKILKRLSKRITDEKPTVDKIIRYFAAAGLATIGGVAIAELGPGLLESSGQAIAEGSRVAVESAPDILEKLRVWAVSASAVGAEATGKAVEFARFIVDNSPKSVKVAAGISSGWASLNILSGLAEKVGIGAGKSAKKEEAALKKDNKEAVKNLRKIVKDLREAGQDELASRMAEELAAFK